MKKVIYILILITITIACNQKPKTVISKWVTYDESEEIATNANHPSKKMQFKLIQSKILDKNGICF